MDGFSGFICMGTKQVHVSLYMCATSTMKCSGMETGPTSISCCDSRGFWLLSALGSASTRHEGPQEEKSVKANTENDLQVVGIFKFKIIILNCDEFLSFS